MLKFTLLQDLYNELVEGGKCLTSVHAARLQGLQAQTQENKEYNQIVETADKVR